MCGVCVYYAGEEERRKKGKHMVMLRQMLQDTLYELRFHRRYVPSRPLFPFPIL